MAEPIEVNEQNWEAQVEVNEQNWEAHGGELYRSRPGRFLG